MKIKSRNPYLQQTASGKAHKYQLDLNTGKYYLTSEDGSQTLINKIGTLKPKYHENISGFASPKERYKFSLSDKSALPFFPKFDLEKEKLFYTPSTKKYFGYAQQPYRMKSKNRSEYLSKPNDSPKCKIDTPGFKSSTELKSSETKLNQSLIKYKKKNSFTLQHSITSSIKSGEGLNKYFQASFASMSKSKPFPKKVKLACYNYRCKHLKIFAEQETESGAEQSSLKNTLSKNHFDKILELQKLEYSTFAKKMATQG